MFALGSTTAATIVYKETLKLHSSKINSDIVKKMRRWDISKATTKFHGKN